jgi:hypothetical protein
MGKIRNAFRVVTGKLYRKRIPAKPRYMMKVYKQIKRNALKRHDLD